LRIAEKSALGSGSRISFQHVFMQFAKLLNPVKKIKTDTGKQE
jgi:hypothetical protein